MSDSELVPVIQADRELLADAWQRRGFEDQADEIRNGAWDDDIDLRAIARHRLASEAQVKVLREALEKIAECNLSINGLIARTALSKVGEE